MLTLTLLTVCSMTLCGCVSHPIRVIPADRAAVRMPADKPYTPAINGYFVPDARMLELLERALTSTNSSR